MEVIHPNTSLTPVPELDLFGVPPTQNSIIKDITTEHRPLASVDNASVLEFQIVTGIDEYLRMDETELYVKIKFTINEAATWTGVYPVQNLLHSMIKQVDMYIGDRLVTTSPQTYGYKAYIENFLGATEEAKKTHLTSGLWYELAEKDSIKTLIQSTKVMELMGRLHVELAQQDRLILGGATIKIIIHLNSPKFYMIAGGNQLPDVEIMDASIFAHRSKVHPDVVIAHNKALEVAPSRYPICQAIVKSFTISRGDSSIILDNVHNGQLPRRIFVCMVSNDAFIGNYAMNPFEFNDFGISYLSAHLNGVQYPPRPYQPDFTNKLYIREMRDLFRSLQQANADTTIPITRYNYATGNVIFGFNFAPDLSGGCLATNHANPINTGVLRLEMRFKEALEKAITVLVYCDFDKVLEIDSTRNARVQL